MDSECCRDDKTRSATDSLLSSLPKGAVTSSTHDLLLHCPLPMRLSNQNRSFTFNPVPYHSYLIPYTYATTCLFYLEAKKDPFFSISRFGASYPLYIKPVALPFGTTLTSWPLGETSGVAAALSLTIPTASPCSSSCCDAKKLKICPRPSQGVVRGQCNRILSHQLEAPSISKKGSAWFGLRARPRRCGDGRMAGTASGAPARGWSVRWSSPR